MNPSRGFNYFFHGLTHYSLETVKSIDYGIRMKQVLALKEGLLEGWILLKRSEMEAGL